MKKESLQLPVMQKIAEAIRDDRDDYESNSRHAAVLGINEAVYCQIIRGQVEKKLDKSTWMNIARRLKVDLRGEEPWKTVETPVYIYITQQLADCQQESLSKILCDIPNIGKTHSAKSYALGNKNAVYVDCSLFKTRNKLIRAIAREFGLLKKGSFEDLSEDLYYYINSIDRPLIILDEAGDLNYEAFLELKAIWNATDEHCGWYMMGATGLKVKINRAIENEKLGFSEIFSRFDDDFGFVVPRGDTHERTDFIMTNVAAVIKANAPAGTDIRSMTVASCGSLRKAKTKIKKLRLGE